MDTQIADVWTFGDSALEGDGTMLPLAGYHVEAIDGGPLAVLDRELSNRGDH